MVGEALEKGAAKAARYDEGGRVGPQGAARYDEGGLGAERGLTMSSIASQADIEKHALALAGMSAFGSLRD